MIRNSFSDASLDRVSSAATLRRPCRRSGWSRVIATLRSLQVFALATLVIVLVSGHSRGVPRLGVRADVAPSSRASVSRAASWPRAADPSRGASACRLVGPSMAFALSHRARPLRDGSAGPLVYRDIGKADLSSALDDDLGGGRDASCDADDPTAAFRGLGRAPSSGRPLRRESATDPSRFAAGRALPRGPPA